MKINIKKLLKRCNQPEEDFLGNENFCFIDNGADILAIAHLDSVQQTNKRRWKFGKKFYHPKLDDRLGLYIILDYLPRLGLKYDILLTTNEEMGQSTAALFESTKQYNWIFQFDKAGSDVALYQYYNDHNVELLARSGFEAAYGSYSDIASASQLGAAGFNFGCHYVDYHQKNAHVDLRKLKTQLEQFVVFFEANHSTPIPYDPDSCDSWYDEGFDYNDYLDQVELWPEPCQQCGHKENFLHENYCYHCGMEKSYKLCDCQQYEIPLDWAYCQHCLGSSDTV